MQLPYESHGSSDALLAMPTAKREPTTTKLIRNSGRILKQTLGAPTAKTLSKFHTPKLVPA